MTSDQTVATDLVSSISEFAELPAMSDQGRTITYGRLGQFVANLREHLEIAQVVGIFGSPGIAMATGVLSFI
jgi:hypothetical protein